MTDTKRTPHIINIKEEIVLDETWNSSTSGCFPADKQTRVYQVDEKTALLDHDYIECAAALVLKEMNDGSRLNLGRRRRAKKLICEKCNKEFLLPISLKIHIETHEDVDSFHNGLQNEEIELVENSDAEVDVVNIFDQEESPLKEENHLLPGAKITSEEPSAKFSSPAKIKHISNKRTCPICAKVLHRDSMTNHLNSHARRKPFTCCICNEHFGQKHSMIRHMTLHSSDHARENFAKCEICGRYFSTKCLNIHMKVAHSERVSCEICGMTFSTNSNLHAHIKLHIGEKKHECKVCEKKFLYKSALRKHMKFHIDLKDRKATTIHQCKRCGTKFYRSSGLRRHMKTVHAEKNSSNGLKPYCAKFHNCVCSFCTKSFRWPNELRDHILGYHFEGNSNRCPLCNKIFEQRDRLNQHILGYHGGKIHLCDVCKMTFHVKKRLVYHFAKCHGEKPYNCPVCGKRFQIKNDCERHKRVHTGEKPFKCEICGKKFSFKSNMLNHHQTHTKKQQTKKNRQKISNENACDS